MANLVKLPKKTTNVVSDEPAPHKDDDAMTSPPSKEAAAPAKSGTPEQIEVAGRTFDIVERRKLHASPKANIPDAAVYPVVVEEDKNGKKTFKAVYEERLYTIKNYGKGDDEVIIKLRESRGPRTRSTSTEEAADLPELSLEDDVMALLRNYKALEHKLDPETWLNTQLRKILTEEVGRLEKLRDGMKKLPGDLLGELAGADPAMLDKIRAMLRGS